MGGRQERQAEVEEVVEAVMPLRSILLGAEARQDYWGFLTRMSQLEDACQIAHDKTFWKLTQVSVILLLKIFLQFM